MVSLNNLVVKPVSIKIPFPWAVGRLWNLRASGFLIQHLSTRKRLFTFRHGHISGVWMNASDPILEKFPEIQLYFGLQPDYLSLPPQQAQSWIVDALLELSKEFDETTLSSFIKDTLEHSLTQDGNIYWIISKKIEHSPVKTKISIPEIFWSLTDVIRRKHESYFLALPLTNEDFHRALDRLRDDDRISPEFRNFLKHDLSILPGEEPTFTSEKIFLSLFITPDHSRTIRKPPISAENIRSRPVQDKVSRSVASFQIPQHSLPKVQPSLMNPASHKNHAPLPPSRNESQPVQTQSEKNGEQTDLIFLEQYVDSLEHIRAFSYQSKMWDYYKILGVHPSASQEEIKKRFIILSKKLHPDLWHDAEEEKKRALNQLYGRVQDAYETLRDPEKREEYDRKRQLKSKRVEVLEQEEGFIHDDIIKSYIPRALSALKKGHYEEAVRWFSAYQSLKYDVEIAALNACLKIFSRKTKRDGLLEIESLKDQHPENPIVLWLYIHALSNAGYEKKAKKLLKQLKKKHARFLIDFGNPFESKLKHNSILIQYFIQRFQ